MRGDRDYYCGSNLVADAAATKAYIAAHPSGWVVADPAIWERYVDRGSRAVVELLARRVDSGDPTILVWHWG